MGDKGSVLVIGEAPEFIDFSDPAIPPGLDAGKIRAGLEGDRDRLNALGYDAEICWTDAGDTAEQTVRSRLEAKRYDCVVIGAGIRIIPVNFDLFEKLINVVHRGAPDAKLAFNNGPDTTAAAVQRWL